MSGKCVFKAPTISLASSTSGLGAGQPGIAGLERRNVLHLFEKGSRQPDRPECRSPRMAGMADQDNLKAVRIMPRGLRITFGQRAGRVQQSSLK
jgi:hypothetical protein